LLPKHEHIIFQVAGCRSPSARRDQIERGGPEAREFTIKSFLHRSTRVRLCSTNDGGLFLGPIIDRSDRIVRGLITEGLARFNPSTADFSPSAIEYERCECEAKAQKRIIWSDEPTFEGVVQSFQGEVRRILGTAALEVDVRGESRVVQFSCIRVPPFIPGGGSEPFSFEARERLRKLLIGQYVEVIVDGATSDRFFGTVFHRNTCVNELLLQEGFARVHEPICGHESDRMAIFRKAQADAIAGQVGSHSRVEVAPLVVRDYSLNTSKDVATQHLPEFRNVKMRGIVEDILGGNRFALLVPDRRVMVRCAVNGLIPLSPSDRLGQEAMAFCAQRYLNRDIEFSIQEVDRSGGYIANMCLLAGSARVDIAVALLAEGLAEIHDRTASALPNFQQLIEVRDKATRNGYGKWANPSRFEASVEVGRFYPVRLIRAATAVEFIVQFLSETMHEIDEVIQTATPPITRALTRNDLVCVVHQGARYRGRIEKADDAARIRVRLIDFDAVMEVGTAS
jgi:staphylococcal nuclease domain-containing protein 1